MPVNNIIEGTASGVVLDVDTNSVGNIGGGEDDLIVSTIPANTLDVDHKYIHFSASGRFATSVSNKQLRAYFGSTKIFDSGSLAITTASDWILEGWIIRISATSEHALVKFESSSSVLLASALYSTPAEDLTTQVVLKCTGAGTSDNDITQTDLIVDVNNGGTGLGDVSGPSSSIDGHFASFNGTTGKVIKDGTQPTTLANDLLWSAKGQLAVGVGVATGTVLSLGTNGQVLSAATGTANGLQWSTLSSGNTHDLLATISPINTGTVVFSNIPGNYTSLEILVFARSTQSTLATELLIQFNSDTTEANYRRILVQGNGNSSVAAGGADDNNIGTIAGDTSPTNSAGLVRIIIPFYATTNFNKQVHSQSSWRYDNTSYHEFVKIHGLEWENTAVITQIALVLSANNYKSGSIINLYGIN